MNDVIERAKGAIEKNYNGSKKERVLYTAHSDNLVDLVFHNNQVMFLFFDGVASEIVVRDGVSFHAPPHYGLPDDLLIPKLEKVLSYAKEHTAAEKCPACKDLFDRLLEKHRSISELPDDDYYYLITAWDFHTHAIEKAHFSPIIYFYSVAERGKSRTIMGMVGVARRGLRKGNISDAQLLRDCTHLGATLGFDMMDFWTKVKHSGSEDIILNRFEKGLTVSRVNRPDKGPFLDTDYYRVFGPTVLATNEIIHDIADTRAIPIIMQKSLRDFEDEVSFEDLLSFREELVGWRMAHLHEDFPIPSKIVKSRLGDILRPLHQIICKVAPEYNDVFSHLAKKIEDTKLTDKSNSMNAEILIAMRDSQLRVVHGVVASQTVSNTYNERKDEMEKIKSRRIGNVLKSLGFQQTTTGTGAMGFFWNEDLLQRLLKEYGVYALISSKRLDTSDTSEL